MGVLLGMICGPCLLCDDEGLGVDVEPWQIVLMVIFFPITLLFFMGLGVAKMCCGQDEDWE